MACGSARTRCIFRFFKIANVMKKGHFLKVNVKRSVQKSLSDQDLHCLHLNEE